MKNIKNIQIRELLENDANVNKYLKNLNDWENNNNIAPRSNKEQLFKLIANEEDNIFKEVKKMSLRVVGSRDYNISEKYTDDDLKRWFYAKWDNSYKSLKLLILDYFLLRHRKIYCIE